MASSATLNKFNDEGFKEDSSKFLGKGFMDDDDELLAKASDNRQIITSENSNSFWMTPDLPEKFPLDHINVDNLVNMLSKIHLAWPEDLPFYDEIEYGMDPSRAKFPASYYHNSDKEKVVLWHAENFRRQFVNKFPGRRPLVMAPKNECGCQKLFPTYINPTALGYPEFLDCLSTVEFLKDFFSPDILSPPTKFPDRIRSHLTVIKKRKANAFEMAVIIVSILIGSGYDAYVVDGFASKTICTIDTTEEYSEPPEKPILDYEIVEEEEEGGNKNFDFAVDYGYLMNEEEEEAFIPASPSKYRFRRKEISAMDVTIEMPTAEEISGSTPSQGSGESKAENEGRDAAKTASAEEEIEDEEETAEEEVGGEGEEGSENKSDEMENEEEEKEGDEEEGASEETQEGEDENEEGSHEQSEGGSGEEGGSSKGGSGEEGESGEVGSGEEGESEGGSGEGESGEGGSGEIKHVSGTIGESEGTEENESESKTEEDNEEDDEEEEEEEEEDEYFEDLPASVKDRYHGKRTHAWILVLPGKRDIDEAFFLEPFSGTLRLLKDPNFLSIEAVFNNKNYWINIQEPVRNLKLLKYNLSDMSCWSKLLIESDRKKKKRQNTKGSGDGPGFQEEDEEDFSIKPAELYLTMPVSWTTDIEISQEDYDRKYPSGSKTIEYNDAMVEVAAPYANPDGLVRRVLKFSGNSRDPDDLIYIEEYFQHRKDKLTNRKWYRDGKLLHEYFDRGRPDALKEHIHVSGRNKPDYPRDLYYYANAHPQSVSHRQIIKKGMIEHFEDRDDHLYYKLTLFGGVLCNTIPSKDDKKKKTRQILDLVKGSGAGVKIGARRKIIKIIEKYERDEEKEPTNDIAEKHLLIEEGRLRIVFHYQIGYFTRNSLEFFKTVKPGQSKYAPVEFKPEDCIEYHADKNAEPMDVYEKFMLLQKMDRDERAAIVKAREAEDEVYQTVISRVQEDWSHEIEPDAYAGDNEEFVKKKDQQLASDETEEDADLSGTDFSTPFFEKYGVPKHKRDEILMKKRIMLHEKVKILRRAYLIKELYEKQASTLREKQEWYLHHMDQMNPTQEEDFNHMYKERLFQMHILEQRMIRHQQETPRQYYNLLVQLLRHPQLNRYTNKKVPPPPPPERGLTEDERARIARELAKLKDCCQFYNIRYSEKKGKKKQQDEHTLDELKAQEDARRQMCAARKRAALAAELPATVEEQPSDHVTMVQHPEDEAPTQVPSIQVQGETEVANL